jgi:hypothetical protein
MPGRVDAVLEVLRRVLVEPIGRMGSVLVIGTIALGGAITRRRSRRRLRFAVKCE